MEVVFCGQNGKKLIENLLKSNDLSQVILESSGKMLMMHVIDNQAKVDELIPTEVIRPLAMRCDMSYQIADYNVSALKMCQSPNIRIGVVNILFNPKHAKIVILYSRCKVEGGHGVHRNQITYLTGQVVS